MKRFIELVEEQLVTEAAAGDKMKVEMEKLFKKILGDNLQELGIYISSSMTKMDSGRYGRRSAKPKVAAKAFGEDAKNLEKVLQYVKKQSKEITYGPYGTNSVYKVGPYYYSFDLFTDQGVVSMYSKNIERYFDDK